jgi:hypothetical protein
MENYVEENRAFVYNVATWTFLYKFVILSSVLGDCPVEPMLHESTKILHLCI